MYPLHLLPWLHPAFLYLIHPYGHNSALNSIQLTTVYDIHCILQNPIIPTVNTYDKLHIQAPILLIRYLQYALGHSSSRLAPTARGTIAGLEGYVSLLCDWIPKVPDQRILSSAVTDESTSCHIPANIWCLWT